MLTQQTKQIEKEMLILTTLLLVTGMFGLSTALRNMKVLPDTILRENRSTRVALDIIQGVLSGPLKGKKVTLVTGMNSEEEETITRGVMERLSEPVTLLRFSKELSALDPQNQGNGDKLMGNSSQKEEEYFHRLSSDTGSVLMLTGTEDDRWWPFHSPSMIAKDLILVSLWTTCLTENFFQTPLFSKIPFVALICPSRLQDEDTPYKVWTWKPYARNHQFVPLGRWNSKFFASWDRIFIDRYDDMSRKEIRILGNPEGYPFFYNISDGSLMGVSYDIMVEFASKLHFTLNITVSKKYQWDFMLEKVKAGESDLFLNYVHMTAERNAEFDLLTPFIREGYGVMLINPPPLPRWENIIYPFAWTVWLAIVVAMICTSVMYHVLRQEHEKSFLNNTLDVLQFMLSNAMARIPRKWLIRNFLMVWWIVSWILQLSYTCNLIAVLTIPVFPKWIQTLQELESSDYRTCMLDYGSFVPDALKTSSEPVLAGLGSKLYQPSMNFTFEHAGEEYCADLVLEGTHGHIEAYSYIYLMYRFRGHEDLTYRLREQLYPSYVVLIARKHSPWSNKLSQGIQKMLEAGFIEKWYQDEMKIQRHIDARSTELQPLSMDHLQGSFYMMNGGFILSAVAFAQELVGDFRRSKTTLQE